MRAACLDVVLARLPRPRNTFVLGIDDPLYCSVHTATTPALAPGGQQIVSLARYLAPGEHGDGEAERELEGVLDLTQPGWRALVVQRRFLPNLTVSNAVVATAGGGLPGRAGAAVPGADGLFVTGDWVGPRGMLADAVLASAKEAGTLAGRAARRPGAGSPRPCKVATMPRATASRTDVFEEYRRHMFGVAYRMLGSAADAEDIVQEAWLRWRESAPEELRSERSWLTTVATRLCLDQLKSARARREQYAGPWLPEPVPTEALIDGESPEARAEALDSISFAFMVLLERLAPLERAVFLLRDVFDFDYHEIAPMVARSEPACRQTLRRARQRLAAGPPRFTASYEERLRLTEAFIRAATGGDVPAFAAAFTADVVQWADGGGKVKSGLHPIYGREKVVRLFAHQAAEIMGARVGVMGLNGQPAVVISRDGVPSNVIFPEFLDGQVYEIRVVRNPDKLAAVRRAIPRV